MKLMKKLGAICAATVLTLAMGMCTFAAGSSSTDNQTQGATAIEESQLPPTTQEAIKKQAANKGQYIGTFVINDKMVRIAGVQPGETVTIYEVAEDGSLVEVGTFTADENGMIDMGKLAGKEVAVIKNAKTAAAATTDKKTTTATTTAMTTTSTTSPKTGATPVAAIATVAMVMFAAGAVVCGKKRA